MDLSSDHASIWCNLLLFFFAADQSIISQVNHKPVVGEPYTLRCPLEFNSLLATYTWTKYGSLDRTMTNITSNVIFSDNYRQWRVNWYEPHHNGLYVCHVSTSKKNQSFYHDTLFFLQANRKCSHHMCSYIVLSDLSALCLHTHHKSFIDSLFICCISYFYHGTSPCQTQLRGLFKLQRKLWTQS